MLVGVGEAVGVGVPVGVALPVELGVLLAVSVPAAEVPDANADGFRLTAAADA